MCMQNRVFVIHARKRDGAEIFIVVPLWKSNGCRKRRWEERRIRRGKCGAWKEWKERDALA